ncbi:hypothetical protein ACJRO7_017152 [Eucalyptus globulus]|uniref:Uncharacterized protein n=1 Tax=Eucalyptus globulus TaxID=34317 RepID=A0ABD3KQ31_EUCGL
MMRKEKTRNKLAISGLARVYGCSLVLFQSRFKKTRKLHTPIEAEQQSKPLHEALTLTLSLKKSMENSETPLDLSTQMKMGTSSMHM